MTTIPVMQRLKSETKTAHQHLEKLTMPYIKGAKDDASYARLLQLFHGFFQPMEAQIHRILGGTGVIADLAERRQSTALQADLQTLGAAANDLQTMEELPPVETIAQALGALYVLEGSTLGGRIITGILAKQTGRAPEDGITFFNGYGEATNDKWAAFTTTVNDYATAHPGEANAIVKAADETFKAFAGWVAISEGQPA